MSGALEIMVGLGLWLYAATVYKQQNRTGLVAILAVVTIAIAIVNILDVLIGSWLRR